MKKRIVTLSVLIVMIAVMAINSCKKSTPAALELGSIMIGTIDLNGATAPTNVPVNPVITATFTTDVDAATATTSNITLTQDYNAVSMPLTITVAGPVVTITPTPPLANGALYKLDIGAGLKATNGEALTPINRSFTTIGTFMPAGAYAYWNFDGNANDQTGVFNAVSGGIMDITYVTGRNAASGQAAKFNGTTSLIKIPNGDMLDNTADFSISFWMKSDTTGKRHQFVLGLDAFAGFQFEWDSHNDNNTVTPAENRIGWCKLAVQYVRADASTFAEDLYFPGSASGTTKDNGGYQTWTFSKDLISNSGTGVNGLLAQVWAHIVCTYDHATKIGTMYINGQEMKAQDFNLYPAGDTRATATGLKYGGDPANNSLVFGFIQDNVAPVLTGPDFDYTNPAANHFQGELDDVAIYHSVLTPAIITQMYNSGKP